MIFTKIYHVFVFLQSRYVTTALSLVKSPDASEISRYQRKVVKLLQSALDEQFKEVRKKVLFKYNAIF